MAALRELRTLRWAPAEDDNGDLIREGWTKDGREVIGLYCLDPIVTIPSMAEQVAAWPDLVRSAGR